MDLRQSQIRMLEKFAHLYDSGIALPDALEMVSQSVGEPLQAALGEVVQALYAGTSLADAMAAEGAVFGGEVVGIVRAGEARGELGEAARAAADGLRGGILDPVRLSEEDLDRLLEGAQAARVLHLDPGGRLRLRFDGRLLAGDDVNLGGAGPALARRAGIEGFEGRGAFLWRDRLLRVAIAGTPDGPTTTVRFSAPPGEEPRAASVWRAGAPGLLLVVGDRWADHDSCLRAILAGCGPDAKCVAVDLPAPEAIAVASVEAAIDQDPDVICVGRADGPEPLRRALDAGIRVVAGALSAKPFEAIPRTVVALEGA